MVFDEGVHAIDQELDRGFLDNLRTVIFVNGVLQQ
jgi:hypothetical protein